MKKINIFFGCLFLLFNTLTAQNRTDSLHIDNYDIQLNITDFTGHQIYGNTTLTAIAKVNGLASLSLDFQSLIVDSVNVNGNAILHFEHENNLLTIPLQNIVNQGDTIFSTIYYHGVPAKDSRFGGFYFSGNYAFNIGVAFQYLPHNFGRAWYPCLDFFNDKSTYQFHIETLANHKAICGGVLVDSVFTDSNTMIWHWNLTKPVSSYLTSVAVGEYQQYHDTVQGMERIIPIDIYAYPTSFDKVHGSFSNLKQIIQLYEQKFGAYPWDRVGYVEVAFNAGAMEHVANIAYPHFAITNNNTYESLYAHELSHMWFGDLITCNRAEEMWINEGFATYIEAIVKEALYPNDNPEIDGYRSTIRDLHYEVLESAHTDDGGYFALNNVPQNVTYGSTSYKKGGLIVHALRKYMGDSLFFSSIQQLLHEKQFETISSEELFHFLTQKSGIDLTDFYESHINQPGFLHFSIDSIRPIHDHEYHFYVRQRLSHATHLGRSNFLDITFFSSTRQQYTITGFECSEEYADGIVTLPFTPLFAVIDYNEKLADAVIDANLLLKDIGTTNASSANFRIKVNSISDTTLLRVEDNLVTPDTFQMEHPNIFALSRTHYWRIAMTPENTIDGTLRFFFHNWTTSRDYELLRNHTIDEIQLLYRRSPADEWQMIPTTHSGNLSTGCLNTNNIAAGEYVLAIGNPPDQILDTKDSSPITIQPNPTSDIVTISFSSEALLPNTIYQIYDVKAQLIQQGVITDTRTTLSIKDCKPGTYFIKISSNNKKIKTFKIVKK